MEQTYVACLQAFFQDIVRFKQSPKQLAINLNVPWSLIEPYMSSYSKTNGMGSSGMSHDVLAFYLAQDWCDCAHLLLSKYNQSLLSLEAKEALEGEEEDNTIPSQQHLYKQQQPSQQQLNEQLPTSLLPLPLPPSPSPSLLPSPPPLPSLSLSLSLLPSPSSQAEYICGTNRLGERLFSLLNRLWKDNNNVQSPIVSAMAKFKLRNKARCCINIAITRKVRDAHHLKQSVAKLNKKVASQQQRQKAQKAEKDVVNYLHHINFLPSGSKLTVTYLKKFLHSKQILFGHFQ
ncbi:hypothetical protein QOT17_024688 [Balamuthia mandrillaris]